MPQKIGKFQILKTLGKGSMGEVLLAVDEVLGRQVAIKTVLPGTSFGTEAQARFVREAKATAGMNHPNIVTVFDFGEQDGLHYLVLELVEGKDLETLITQGSLSKPELLEALAQTCEGLAYAHERGVIHRDVKPSNILVTQQGKRIQAKLTDFGVALVDRSNLTEQGVWMGTVNYMAPEYLDTGKATPSSDLFAVGVMLYEVLTGGRKPFTGETTSGILNAILQKPMAPLNPQEVGDLPAAILEVSRKALAKDPAERYATGDVLARAIREAVAAPAGLPPPGRPPAVPPSPPVPSLGTPPKGTHFPAPGTPIVVGKGQGANCLSLRVALRQALPGAHITVLPGLYRETLVIDKDITISVVDDGTGVHLESPQGPCLRVEGCHVTLRGLSFQQVAGNSSPLVLIKSGQITLEGCDLQSAGSTVIEGAPGGATLHLARCKILGTGPFGLSLGEGNTANLADCQMEGATRALLSVGPSATLAVLRSQLTRARGVGILLDLAAQATVEDCGLEELWAGALELGPEARLQARRCRIHGSEFAGLLALEKSSAVLEDCELSGHGGSGAHALGGASVQLRNCRLRENDGFGISVQGQSILALETCEIAQNGHAGVFIHRDATAQLKDCKVIDGRAMGLICSSKGRGVLEGCEIAGNAKSGAKVEPGGSLLLVRCVVRDGHDTGIMLFQDAEATLEECVVHRNARGGILLAKDGADPILRGGNRIEDDLVRLTPQGPVKLTPVKKR